MIELYGMDFQGENIYKVNIDKKYISGWCVEERHNNKWMTIYTSFGKEIVIACPNWELESEWDMNIGKKRLDAFNRNMAVLNEL